MTADAAVIRPDLVAHRGHARRCPENTIPALESALAAGATFVEVDVQLTADGTPVVIHDPDLRRTGGVDTRVMELELRQLRGIEVNETARLGDAFRGVRVPTLEEVARLLTTWPAVTVFVELKSESLDHFGTDLVVRCVLEAMAPVHERCVIISFDRTAIEAARIAGAGMIGWVIDAYSEAVRARLDALAPEYVFCDHRRLPADGSPLWPGPWRWAIYEVTDADLALRLARRGARLVETMAIEEMIRHPRLRPAETPDA